MEPATRFGPYEIVRRLGKSMNSVYLAVDTRENRQAALKLIKSGADPVSRLILEAERRGAAIQQRLRELEPRVLEIYDYGDKDGYFYVAMQYVEGRNLAEVLGRDGRMSAYRAELAARAPVGARPAEGAVAEVAQGAGDLPATGKIPRVPAGRWGYGGGGAWRYQAVEHPSEPERHGAAAGFRHRQGAAGGPGFHLPQFRQPELLLA